MNKYKLLLTNLSENHNRLLFTFMSLLGVINSIKEEIIMALPGIMSVLGTLGTIAQGVSTVTKIIDDIDTCSSTTSIEQRQPQLVTTPIVTQQNRDPVEVVNPSPINLTLNINIFVDGEKLNKIPAIDCSSTIGGQEQKIFKIDEFGRF